MVGAHVSIRPVTRRRAVLLLWLLLMAWTSALYLRAALQPPPGRVFAGTFHWIDDVYNYVSYVQQAEDGAFLFRNKLLDRRAHASRAREPRVVGRGPRVSRSSGAALPGLPAPRARGGTLALRRRGGALAARAGSARHPPPAGPAPRLPRGRPRRSPLRADRPARRAAASIWPWPASPSSRSSRTRTSWPAPRSSCGRCGASRPCPGREASCSARPRDGPGPGAALRPRSPIGADRPRPAGVAAAPPAGGPARGGSPTTRGCCLEHDRSRLLGPTPPSPSPPARSPAGDLGPGRPARPDGAGAARTAEGAGPPPPGALGGARALVVAAAARSPFSLQFVVGVGVPLLVLGAAGLARFAPPLDRPRRALPVDERGGGDADRRSRTTRTGSCRARGWRRRLALRGLCLPGDRVLAPPDIGLYVDGLTACHAFVAHPAAPDYDERLAEARAFYARGFPRGSSRARRPAARHAPRPAGRCGSAPAGWLGGGHAVPAVAQVGPGLRAHHDLRAAGARRRPRARRAVKIAP